MEVVAVWHDHIPHDVSGDSAIIVVMTIVVVMTIKGTVATSLSIA